MTFEIGLVFGIITLAMLLFFTEKFSIDTIAIGIMALFMFTGILDLEEGFAGFSNPATVTVAAMFVISSALFNTGILDNLGPLLAFQAKSSEHRMVIVLMLLSGTLSAFINDTAVVALLMPTVIQVAKKQNISPSKLLMPLSFGALMGGICTLLGTSTNILVSGIVERAGLPEFGVFEMSLAGLGFFLVGMIYMSTVGIWLIPRRKPGVNISEEIRLGNYLVEILIGKEYEQLNEQLLKQRIFKTLGIDALQIIRSDGRKVKAYPNTSIQEGDLIRISCDKDSIQKLKKIKGIGFKGELEFIHENIIDEDSNLYEALVTPSSSLINKALVAVNFRNLYDQITLIGIRHRTGMMEKLLRQTTLRAGDILLLRASEESIQQLMKSEDLLLLAENKTHRINKLQSILTIMTLAAIVILSAFKIFPIALAAVGGAVILIVLRSITPTEAYKAIDWKVIFMLAGVLSMGAALEKTGGAAFLGSLVVDNLGQFGPQAVLAGVFGLTFMMTNIMSNNATAALLAPIAINIATSLEVDSRPLVMAVTFAASLSFMTPMGYQTNTMIYNPGNYKFKDYLIVGIPLNLIMWGVSIWLIPYFFPF